MKLPTAILRFDEDELRTKLEKIPARERSAFAAACAERLLPSYLRYTQRTGRGNPDLLSSSLAHLWAELSGNFPMSDEQLERDIENALSLIPDEDESPWVMEQAAADDAAAAVAYALRSRQKASAQDAAWAARRAFEAVTYYVDNVRRPPRKGQVRILDKVALEHTLAAPLTQAELARQQRDLDELAKGTVPIDLLHQRSHDEAPELAFPEIREAQA